jgi:hypothetical protein
MPICEATTRRRNVDRKPGRDMIAPGKTPVDDGKYNIAPKQRFPSLRNIE